MLSVNIMQILNTIEYNNISKWKSGMQSLTPTKLSPSTPICPIKSELFLFYFFLGKKSELFSTHVIIIQKFYPFSKSDDFN